jgi:peptidoglycan/LPS O-acetylase OafA/YrhL
MTSTNVRFAVLDAWRGLAALGVALFHIQFSGLLTQNNFSHHSFLFVDFFFVFSGFVIMHGYGEQLDSMSKIGSFMIKRFARLVPLHLLTLSLLILAQLAMVVLFIAGKGGTTIPPFTGAFEPIGIVQHIAFLTVFGLEDTLTWNVPAWSVASEVWAYLLFALVALATMAKPNLRTIAFIVLAASGALVVIYGPEQSIDVTYDLGFARCVYGFFTGALVKQIWEAAAGQSHTRVQSRDARVLGNLREVAVLALVICFIIFAGRGPASLFAPLVFALAIIVFAQQVGVISSILLRAPFQALGKWSYATYLLQFPMIYGFSLFLGILAFVTGHDVRNDLPAAGGQPLVDLGSIWLNDLATLAFLAVLTGLAAITHQFIEEPARKALSRYAR